MLAQMLTERHVPFLNLNRLYQDHRREFDEALSDSCNSGSFIEGKQLLEFENKFAEWIGKGSYAVGCGNGTDAIAIAAKALEISPGSEALLPAMTFVATAEGVLHAGLNVRLVDVTSDTYLMDVNALEKSITPKTKLIVPVHLYGQMAPMDEIRAIADKHKCFVMEDASQAHGAKWKNQPVGTFSDVATFSFYPGKNLGAFGDGGAILSKDHNRILLCSLLGKHGGLKKYEHWRIGYNSRLDTLQAAILNIKLKYIEEWNRARRQVALWYQEALNDVKEITLPIQNEFAMHVYHLYVIRCARRDDLARHLSERLIGTGVHYPRALHQLPALNFLKAFSFPNAEKLAKEGLSLPMCPTLTREDISYVADSVRSFFGSN